MTGEVKDFLHGRQDSNLQPAVLETAALPIELRPCFRYQAVQLSDMVKPDT